MSATTIALPQETPDNRILVVDDNPVNLGVMMDYLRQFHYKLAVATNGELALERAKRIQPDIILLDVMMPGIDGFETCRRLQEDETTRDIPVIFMTALADGDSKVKGLTSGAVDYVTKPIHHEEVLARVRTHLQIRNLTGSLQRQAAEIKVLNEQLKEENLAMKAEMELAHRIQASILPNLSGNVHPEFEFAAVMQPCAEVGGDYYDVLFDKAGHLWLAIGDVSGHGVTPGLIMLMAQTLHAGFTAHWSPEPKDVINQLNASLYRNVTDRLQADHFMTFTTLKYQGEGRFDYAGAHLDLIAHRAAGNTCDLFDTPGCYLNFISDISHATQQLSLTLEVGDTLVLYTDGLIEAQNPGGVLLENQRFTDIITRHAAKSVEAMRDGIMDDVLAYSHGVRKDDMTLLLARRTA